MFKSKTIGWITALTLLCVAGVALACRLKEGSGAAAQAATACKDQAEDKEPASKPTAPPETQTLAKAIAEALDGPSESVPPLPEPTLNHGVNIGSKQSTPPPVAPATLPEKMTPKIGEAVSEGPPAPPPAELPATVPAMPEVKKEEPNLATPVPVESNPPAPLVATPTIPPADLKEPTTVLSKPDAGPANVTPIPTAPEAKNTTGVAMPSVPESGITTAIPKTEGPLPTKPEATTPPPEDKVYAKPAPEPTPEPKPAEAKIYTAKSGETLRDIAKKTLGSADRWKELDYLNPDLRAGTIVPSGTVIRLPGDASAPPVGGQAESETGAPTRFTKLKALPIVRMRKPDSSKVRSPMIGSFECKMDDKLGLFIPNNVFEQFDKSGHLLLTPGPDQCLWLVTQTGAARVVERVEKAHLDNSDVEGFRRLFYSQSARCKVELKTGRVEIPEKLAEYAGLSGEVVLVGVEDHFELWDSARWQKYSQQKASMSKTE